MTAIANRFQYFRRYGFGIGRTTVWITAFLGILAMLYRWFYGLGASTALSDGRGWGIWISLDLLVGIAVAAGAFTVAATIYIFNLKQFEPLLRPTILTGFIGYFLAPLSLMVDLGRPERIWHLLLYTNIHSPLAEIGWCVMLYTTVLALEFSPEVFKALGWKVPLRLVRALMIPLVITGIVLSFMHQSSLGTMMTIAEPKVHPLWYSYFTPFYFFLTAFAAGICMLVFEAFGSSKVYHFEFEQHLFAKLVKPIPWVLGAYLVLRLVDFTINNKFQYLLENGFITALFLIEILIGVIAPIILFSRKSVREKPYPLFWTAMLVLLGLLLNRVNISLIELKGPVYIPAWTEILVSLGLVSIGFIMYDITARLYPIFPQQKSTSTQ